MIEEIKDFFQISQITTKPMQGLQLVYTYNYMGFLVLDAESQNFIKDLAPL